MTGPLTGKRVLVTRERPGELGALLEARGAEVIHVPLIEIREPLDGEVRLRDQIERMHDGDWLVVTSAAGAERVGAAAARRPEVRLACVGTASASVLARLAGRPVDAVPDIQQAISLADLLIRLTDPEPARFLIAQADRASPVLADRLREAGHVVATCVAYRTVLLRPDHARVADADALVFASGSSVQSWVDAYGPSGPEVIVAIGPATEAAARELGLKITSVAADHSVTGLVNELERHLIGRGGATWQTGAGDATPSSSPP